ncbi:MAG: hypothetical protein LBP59_16475 [Planctomycetaceae bacterium]|nr:hypothetical protein [Planctomycetaceae bacterium]
MDGSDSKSKRNDGKPDGWSGGVWGGGFWGGGLLLAASVGVLLAGGVLFVIELLFVIIGGGEVGEVGELLDAGKEPVTESSAAIKLAENIIKINNVTKKLHRCR